MNKQTPTKILYLCIECFQIHYDNYYCKRDGDIKILGKFKDKYLEYCIMANKNE